MDLGLLTLFRGLWTAVGLSGGLWTATQPLDQPGPCGCEEGGLMWPQGAQGSGPDLRLHVHIRHLAGYAEDTLTLPAARVGTKAGVGVGLCPPSGSFWC